MLVYKDMRHRQIKNLRITNLDLNNIQHEAKTTRSEDEFHQPNFNKNSLSAPE